MTDLLPECLTLTPEPSAATTALPAHGGVYAILDEADRPILVATAEDLRRVVSARLAAPPPNQRTKRANLGEVARSVRWRATFSAFESALRYHLVIRRLDPGGYRELLGFAPLWFIRGDVGEPIPRLTVVNVVADDAARYVGPCATRRDADGLVTLLEDVFDLCRKFDILRRAPHGQPCEYLDMGRCPAPCDGRFPMDRYRAAIAAALDFAAGKRFERIESLRAAMRAAAGRQEFERAALIKGMIERADALSTRDELRHLHDARAYRWLIVQRAGPRSRSARRQLVRAYCVSIAGWAETDAVAVDSQPAVAADWLRWFDSRPEISGASDARERSERLWLVGKFVNKGRDAPGLCYHADELPTVAQLAADVAERFLPKIAEPEPADAPPAVSGDPGGAAE